MATTACSWRIGCMLNFLYPGKLIQHFHSLLGHPVYFMFIGSIRNINWLVISQGWIDRDWLMNIYERSNVIDSCYYVSRQVTTCMCRRAAFGQFMHSLHQIRYIIETVHKILNTYGGSHWKWRWWWWYMMITKKLATVFKFLYDMYSLLHYWNTDGFSF